MARVFRMDTPSALLAYKMLREIPIRAFEGSPDSDCPEGTMVSFWSPEGEMNPWAGRRDVKISTSIEPDGEGAMRWRTHDFDRETEEFSAKEVWVCQPIPLENCDVEAKYFDIFKKDAQEVVDCYEQDGHIWGACISYGFEDEIIYSLMILGRIKETTGWRTTNLNDWWEQDDQGVPPMREVREEQERYTRVTLADFVEACRTYLTLCND